jgi:DNA-binding CsgD family transcriptional regulator
MIDAHVLSSVSARTELDVVHGPFRPTPAQSRVLELVALGLSSREIGARLWISRQTVTYHISNLLVKLDAPTRAGLVARAYALGLLEPGCWPPRAPAFVDIYA